MNEDLKILISFHNSVPLPLDRHDIAGNELL